MKPHVTVIHPRLELRINVKWISINANRSNQGKPNNHITPKG